MKDKYIPLLAVAVLAIIASVGFVFWSVAGLLYDGGWERYLFALGLFLVVYLGGDSDGS